MIQMSKLTLRKHFLHKREGITDSEKISLSSKINKNLQLQKEFMVATNIASYRSFRKEPLLIELQDKSYFYPKIDGSNLTFHSDKNGFRTNKYNIEEPKNKNNIALNEIDIFLVPLISFNKGLYRIGFGGGYYDRTLTQFLNNKSRPKFFGISYDFQLTECKFESKFDVRLDKVITDKKVYV